MQAYQLERLRALIEHAAARVPAYRGVFTEEHRRLRTLDDLARLPIVDKAYFIARGTGAWSVPGAPARVSTTSGTTGQPFTVPWSDRARWHGWVQQLWMMRCMRAPFVGLHVSIRPRETEHHSKRSGIRARLLDRRRTTLPETMPAAEIAAWMRASRPAWVSGQPHVLAAIAAELGAVHRPRLVTTHGVSADDRLQEEITRGFGSGPLDIYGAVEAQQIAWQCHARDLYHLNHDIVVVEVVDDDGRAVRPGEVGHLVLTSLVNSLLPIIRYRIGDSAVVADRPCACGERLPGLVRIEGRTFDWVVDDQGRRVPPQRLWISTVIDHGWNGVARYRVRQDADRRVTIEVVAPDGLDDAYAAELIDAYRVPLGPTTPIEIRHVERIEVPPGERFRQFTSSASPS